MADGTKGSLHSGWLYAPAHKTADLRAKLQTGHQAYDQGGTTSCRLAGPARAQVLQLDSSDYRARSHSTDVTQTQTTKPADKRKG